MFTRKQYLDDQCSHREYYAQLVDERTIATVVATIGADELRASTDPHFNDIPLRRWDVLAAILPNVLAVRFVDLGDYATLGGLVCVAKEAARQFCEGPP